MIGKIAAGFPWVVAEDGESAWLSREGNSAADTCIALPGADRVALEQQVKALVAMCKT